MILIVGATGVLGQRTARRLLAAGHPVRVMTRDPRRAEDLRQQGAEIVVGDLVEPRTLVCACAGADRVFAAAHSIMGRGRYSSERVDDAGHRALIDAAKNARVARFVYASALGASPRHPIDFFRTKHRVEQYLQHSGLEHVILRPSAFMEWHAHELNGRRVLKDGRTLLLGGGAKPRNFVAAADVAELAAKALVDTRMAGEIVEIGGPENFTDSEVAMLYARAAHVPARMVRVPRWLAVLVSHAIRPVHPGIARILRFASLDPARTDETFNPQSLLAHHPMQLTRLEDFVQEQVARARNRSATSA